MKVTREYLKQLIREAIEMEAKSDFVPGAARKEADPSFDMKVESDAQELGKMFASKATGASLPGGIAPRAVQFIRSRLGRNTQIDDAFAIDFVYGMYMGLKKNKADPDKVASYASKQNRDELVSAIVASASK